MRLIPAIERMPALLRTTQSTLGKVALLVLAYGLLQLHSYSFSLQTVAVIAGVTFLPKYRSPIILLGTLGFWILGNGGLKWRLIDNLLYTGGWISEPIGVGARFVLVLAVITFCGLLVTAVSRHRVWANRLPFLQLLVIYIIAMILLSELGRITAWSALGWVALTLIGSFIWFLGYGLTEAGRRQSAPFPIQARGYMPFWNPGWDVPFPKGGSYLDRIEAHTPEELAVSQLKGLKLLAWAFLLTLLAGVLALPVDGYVRLPGLAIELLLQGASLELRWWSSDLVALLALPFDPSALGIREALGACMAGRCPPAMPGALAAVHHFARTLVELAIWGHLIIGIARLAGFNALRNTYRPLRSTSIADFWNRYDFYFKELLVNVIYYPLFLKLRRLPFALRLYVPIFIAVFVVNSVLHALRDIDLIAVRGFGTVLSRQHVDIFFNLLVAHGIYVSQLRLEYRRSSPGLFERRVVAPIVVLGFYCIVSTFTTLVPGADLEIHLRYLGSIIGLI